MSETPEAVSAPPPDPVDATQQVAQQVYSLVLERRQAALARRLQQSAAAMTGCATVVAIGIRSVGKSSLLNALLDREDLLPVEMDVSSNVYVSVGYGPTPSGDADGGERVRVEFSDGRQPAYVSLGQLSEWASEGGNPGNERGVAQVRVRLESAVTKAGILLTDTPGAGGLVAAHGDVVRSACMRANGLLVVVDHVQPISETVLGFVASLGQHVPQVVFAFNKTDISGDTERSIADTKEALVRAGLPELARATMVGTSPYLYREAHELGDDGAPDELMLADSGVPALREALVSAVLDPTRRDQARMVCGDLSDALATLAAPDAGMLRQADGGSEVTEEVVSELRRLDRLDPQRDLERRLDTLLEDADAALRMAITKSTQRLEDELEANFSPGFRESLPTRLDEEIQAAWHQTSDMMRSELITKAEQVIAGIELELPQSKLGGYQPGPLPPIPPLPPGGWRGGLTRLVELFFIPWSPLRHSTNKHQQKIGASRNSGIKYVMRERNDALAAAPRQLRRDYRSQVALAVDKLTAARATRLEALRAVREAVENPPTPERRAAAEERLGVVRPLEARVRDLASSL